MAAIGDSRLLGDAVRFVSACLLEHGDQLAPAYAAQRRSGAGSSINSGLAGYPGGFDRIGNWVNNQFQLDAFGESLLLLADAGRHDLFGQRGSASRRRGGRRHRRTVARTGCRHLGDR